MENFIRRPGVGQTCNCCQLPVTSLPPQSCLMPVHFFTLYYSAINHYQPLFLLLCIVLCTCVCNLTCIFASFLRTNPKVENGLFSLSSLKRLSFSQHGWVMWRRCQRWLPWRVRSQNLCSVKGLWENCCCSPPPT